MPPPAGPRVPLHRSLRLALGGVWIAAAAITAGQIALFLDQPGAPWPALSLFSLTGLVYATAGVVAWLRRPGNRTGALLVAGGGAWFAAACLNTDVPALVAVGLVTATAPLAFVLWLLLGFPSGRLRSRFARVTVLAGFVVAVVLQAPHYLFTPDPELAASLAIADRPHLTQLGALLQSGCGVLVVAATLWILGSRLRRAPRRQSRVLLTVYGYGMVAVLAIPVGSIVLRDLLGLSPAAAGLIQLGLVVGVPLVFLAAVLGGAFRPTLDVHEVDAWGGAGAGDTRSLVVALRGVLGDDTVRLSVWSPEQASYVDADGSPAETAPGDDRGRVEIDAAGRPLAAISFDATVTDDPELVRSAARMTAIALQNEQLSAELRLNQIALQHSRERLVEAADRERRRIAQDLHDGLQMELVLLALQAQDLARLADQPGQLATDAVELRRGLDRAAADLRTLVHAVMPPSLVERGLVAAVEDLADRLPLPTEVDVPVTELDLAPGVASTAYFVISEALTNAVKHAQASRLSVSLRLEDDALLVEIGDDGDGGASLAPVTGGATHGAGLRGMTDRVDVLGGRLRIDSGPSGTRLQAVLPCGS